MKIYTKTGDNGTTALFDGTRVSKDNLRVQAYGEVDELNALLGIVCVHIKDETLIEFIHQVQTDLFALGAQLANPAQKKQKAKAEFSEEKIKILEHKIDECETKIDPIKNFMLPGGTPGAAYLELARTQCRRAERTMVHLHQDTPLDPILVQYINRLSDLLFMLARVVNKQAGVKDIPWKE